MFLTRPELLALCKSCRWKLNDIYTYRKLVLKNQKSYEQKVWEVADECEEDVPLQEEYITEEIEIKAEPIMVAYDSPDRDYESHDEKFNIDVVDDSKVKVEAKVLRTRKKGQTKLFKTERGNVQSEEKFIRDCGDFEIIDEHFDLSCDLCPDNPQFPTYRAITRHYTQAHRARKVFVCCGTRLKNRALLVEHALGHKNPRVCETCGAQFVRDVQFRKHFYECQPRFACDFCHQLFNKKKEIYVHIYTKHIKHPKIICEICGKDFSSIGSVNSHMKRKHGNGKSVSVFEECPECGKKLQKSNLKSHINDVHKRTEPYICSQCGKTFTTRKNFMRHVRTVHVVGRKYKCTIDGCDKALLTPESLREHIATHTGIPLYQCKWCEWSFKSAGNFYAHMRRKHPTEHAQMKQETKKKLYGNVTTETDQQEMGKS